MLGPDGQKAVLGSRTSTALSNALVRATVGGLRYLGAWIQNLSTGEEAGMNT